MTTLTAQTALYDALAKCADSLRTNRTMSDTALAAAFISIGLSISRSEKGEIATAEWLRDIADMTEAPALGRQLN